MRISELSSRLVFLIAAVGLGAACRDKAPAPADSALSQDLALAQRAGAPPTVFNDAPIGGSAAASKAPGSPTRQPEPPRAMAPTPRPVPRRQGPPAQVARAPERTPPQPVATAPAPSPAPAAASEPALGMIGAGSRVGMTTNARLCAVGLLPGDKLSATVTSGAVGSNGASIPAGSTVVLEVASVDQGDPIESSRIAFRVHTVTVNGDDVAASGDVATLGSLERVQASSGNDAVKVAGGAVAGAVLGRIFGHSTKATVIGAAAGAAGGAVVAKRSQGTSDACLPTGSQLRLTISKDIVVRRGGAI